MCFVVYAVIPIRSDQRVAQRQPRPPAATSCRRNACKCLLTHLLQMNLLMKRKNIRTLLMRWTRRSQNCQDSKYGQLAGAITVLGRVLYVTAVVWAGLITPPTPAPRPRPCGLT